MGAITYVAHSRAPLMTTPSPDHTAGDWYSFDIKFQRWETAIEAPKTQHVSLGGDIETVLQRTTVVHNITLVWDDDDHEQMLEFINSIAGGETFRIDPYGSVASADEEHEVVLANQQLSYSRLIQTSTPWRSISLTVRAVPDKGIVYA